MCKWLGIGPAGTVHNLGAGTHGTRVTGAVPPVILIKAVGGQSSGGAQGMEGGVGYGDGRGSDPWTHWAGSDIRSWWRLWFKGVTPLKGRGATKGRGEQEQGEWDDGWWRGEFWGVNSWLDGKGGKELGGGEGNPVPVGAVMSDRDQALQAMIFF